MWYVYDCKKDDQNYTGYINGKQYVKLAASDENSLLKKLIMRGFRIHRLCLG